jgi:Arm DNA-binding domain
MLATIRVRWWGGYMARTINRLSPRFVNTAKKPGRHADGGNLYLIVDKGGAKRWMLLYRWRGRRREMGLGGASAVSVAKARELAGKYRALLADDRTRSRRDRHNAETLARTKKESRGAFSRLRPSC